jgi:type I restriction enzyme, S subunit
MKKGWQKKKLREVCELVNGRAYSKPELLAAGKYRVLRVGNFFTNDHWYYSDMELEEKKYCDTGDLLYAWSASFGPRMWTGGKVIYHYHIWKVVHDSTQIDQKFLFYFFQWDTEKIKEDQGTGTTMMHVSMGSMNERDIQLPPLAEQQRIVGLLDEAFEGLATAKANAEKNLQNARALFESHLQSVFTQRGPGWRHDQLDALTEPDTPITYGVVKPGDEGEITFVRGGDLVRGKVRLTQLRTITRAVSDQYRRTLLRGGELLICLVGQPGQVAVAPIELAGANIARQVGLIRLKKMIDAEFVRYFLQSAPGAEALGARESGSVQQVINLGELRQVSVHYPELAQQRKIVAGLEAMETETQRLARLYERKLAALDSLKKSLLHQAFTGEL